MALSKKKRKIIKKLLKKYSPAEVSKRTGVSEDNIALFIKQNKEHFYHKKMPHPFYTQVIHQVKKIDKTWWYENRFIFLLITVLVWVVYANALPNQFVSDDLEVVKNPEVFTWSYILQNPFQIIRSLSYLFVFKLFGLNPFFFRIINIIFHNANSILVYVFVFLLSDKKTALLTSIFFAVHPVMVESVTWISGGVYSQVSFFIILFLIFALLAEVHTRFIWYTTGILLFAFSTSERAIVIVPLYLLMLTSLGLIKKYKKRIIVVSSASILPLLGILFFFFKRIEILIHDRYLTQGMDNPLVQIPIALSNYLYLLGYPARLSLYQTEISPTTFLFILEVIVTLGFFLAIFYTYKKNRYIFFMLSFFIVSLLPYLTPFRITWLIAERYVYLGSVGILACFSYALSYSYKRYAKLREYLLTGISIVVLLLSIRTVIRNKDWRNEDTLWIATVKASPSSPKAHNNMGDYYIRHGDLISAKKEFEYAIRIKPDYADAYHNYGNVLLRLGKKNEAKKQYEKALSINPNLWQSYLQLAGIFLEEEDTQTSLSYLEKADQISPNNPDILTSFGIFYYKTGETDKAFFYIKKALLINPKQQKAKKLLNAISSS